MANLQVSSEFVLPHSAEQLPPINDGVPLLTNLKQIAPMRVAQVLVSHLVV